MSFYKNIDINRESILTPLLNSSFVNIFQPSSTSSEESAYDAGLLADHSRRLINEVINNIFDEQVGNIELSSSQCSSMACRPSEYSFDKRLQYWKKVIADRKNVEQSIKRKVGKKPGEMLFNRATTIDDRDKQTIKRVMDYAERMNPLSLLKTEPIKLQPYCKIDPETHCHMHIKGLSATLPKAEQVGHTTVEIIGLPAVTREELLGKKKLQGCEKKSLWLRSKQLEKRIEDKCEDIERVIEYYPDIENLQVVGENVFRVNVMKHNSEIELLDEELIKHISTDSSLAVIDERLGTGTGTATNSRFEEEQPPVDYSVRVNEQTFVLQERRSSKSVESETVFVCEPFQNVVKCVIRVENLGMKALSCEWIQRPYYDKNGTLLKPNDDDFIFDHSPFRLVTNEWREIAVRFQPRTVNTVKEKWLLKIDPPFFCRKVDAVIVKLVGKCRPPHEYVDKLNSIHNMVLEKSNKKMLQKLTARMAELTPSIKPPVMICPYQRALHESELFECLNPGYKCERYHDLELLRDLHKRVKKPRESPWDLKLDTLREMVLRLETPDRRALLYSELMATVETMKGCPPPDQLEKIVESNPQRDHACFLFVRGVTIAFVDEWERLTQALTEAFLKPVLREYYGSIMEERPTMTQSKRRRTKRAAGGANETVDDKEKDNETDKESEKEKETDQEKEAEEQKEADEVKGTEKVKETGKGRAKGKPVALLLLDENALKQELAKKLIHNKAFRDTLYIQTYTHLCNCVEDIVSVIESTEHI